MNVGRILPCMFQCNIYIPHCAAPVPVGRDGENIQSGHKRGKGMVNCKRNRIDFYNRTIIDFSDYSSFLYLSAFSLNQAGGLVLTEIYKVDLVSLTHARSPTEANGPFHVNTFYQSPINKKKKKKW